MMNPFLKTKPNYAPTFVIMAQPPKKTVAILPVEDEQNITEEIAQSALKLETPRKITISGDGTGATLFDGSSDAEIRLLVKSSERASKDAKGNVIDRIYAAKTELSDYAKKSEVTEKINYLESILFTTKTAVNNLQSQINGGISPLDVEELNEIREKINQLENTLSEVRNTVENIQNNSQETGGGEDTNLASDEDIDSLFD